VGKSVKTAIDNDVLFCSYGRPGVYVSGKHEDCLSVTKMQFLPDQVGLHNVTLWWVVVRWRKRPQPEPVYSSVV